MQIVLSCTLSLSPSHLEFRQLLNSTNTWIRICLTIFMGCLSIFFITYKQLPSPLFSLLLILILSSSVSAMCRKITMSRFEFIQLILLHLYLWDMCYIFKQKPAKRRKGKNRMRAYAVAKLNSIRLWFAFYEMTREFHSLNDDDKNRYRDEHCISKWNKLATTHIITHLTNHRRRKKFSIIS